MITTTKRAKEMACVRDISKTCKATECMGWEYYIPPTEVMKGKVPHGKEGHGLRDYEKLGYCGLVKRR